MMKPKQPNKQPFFPYIVNPHFSNAIPKQEQEFKENQIKSLPREVLKWIQSLDLTYSVKNIRKDFLNGFLVAQIYSRYYPEYFPMHTIENGYSNSYRKNNWGLIELYLKKGVRISEISLKQENFPSFAEDTPQATQEILQYIIKMFQELTRRKLDLIDYKKYQTDTDNVNKKFFLKDNGEIEPLKKDLDETEKQDTTEINVQQKTNTTKNNTNNMMSQLKASNVIMKGEPKPISQTVLNLTDKNFNIKIVEPKVFEKQMKILRQKQDPTTVTNNNPDLNKTTKSNNNTNLNQNQSTSQLEEKKPQVLNDFIEMSENEQEKQSRIKNPFEWIEERISAKLVNECSEDYHAIARADMKISYLFFKNLQILSIKSLYIVINEINNLIETYYNILSEQINEFINIYLLIFESYLCSTTHDEECEIGGEKIYISKFKMLHDSLIIFFQKCQKNKTEEMTYLFRFCFIEKIFEVMNTSEQEEKLFYFCELIFNLLDPFEVQQVTFIKFIKDNVLSEDLFYDCLGVFHDLLLSYSENFIDGCLFYILNGLKNENSKIRYNSLYILHKYIQMNINFYVNFEKQFERLSNYEPDRENNLVLLKIAITALGYIEQIKLKNKEGQSTKKVTAVLMDKLDDETINTTQLNEVSSPNNIIRNIMIKMLGDTLFIFIASSLIGEVLYDNFDLYKAFVYCLVKANGSIKDYLIFNKQLSKKIEILRTTKFKTIYHTHKRKNWNFGNIFKAYAHIYQFGLDHNNKSLIFDFNFNDKIRKMFLREEDYEFIDYCFGESLNPEWSENWKKAFTGFSKYILDDLYHPDKCERSLKILEKFLYLESIQKQISEEIYEQLLTIIKDLIRLKNESCYNTIVKYLNSWLHSPNSSSMLRDSLRRLIDIKYE